MTSISTRIQLINNFQPLLPSEQDPLNKRIRNSLISVILSSISLLLLIGYGYSSIILELVGIDGVFVWNKTGLNVLSVITISMYFQKYVYQYLLFKHISFLQLSSAQFIEWVVNENLKKIISQLNQPFTSKIALISAGTIVVFVLLNYSLSSHLEYGTYFKIPFVVYTLNFGRLFWNNYKQLIGNLIQAEVSVKFSDSTTIY